jgi:hypothetical protein
MLAFEKGAQRFCGSLAEPWVNTQGACYHFNLSAT